MSRYRKYSTKFFCPRCKQEQGIMQMLYLDTKANLLTCQNHPSYKKECTCRMSDMIIFDMYPETEKELEEVVESAPDATEKEEVVAKVARTLKKVSVKK